MKLQKSKVQNRLLLRISKSICMFFAICFLILTNVAGQVPPNAFNYSGVARDTQGNPIANTNIGIQISILKSSSTGVSQYIENHTVTTDAFGLFNLVIGAGSIQSGDMASIDWSNDNYYLQVGMDAAGGTNFLTMGTTQLLSVPYALYAKSAGSVNSGTGITISSVSATGDSLFLSNGQTFVSGGNSGGNSGGSPVNGYSHYIGEEFGGGVVFHLWKDTLGLEHGLIVDTKPVFEMTFSGVTYEGSSIWSNIQSAFNVYFPFDGLFNSNQIIQQAGHTESAAQLCLNSTNGNQSDWYLPSIGELNVLKNNFTIVQQRLSQIQGAVPLTFFYYWSSTPLGLNYNYAWYLDFATGFSANTTKDSLLLIRAIRAF